MKPGPAALPLRAADERRSFVAEIPGVVPGRPAWRLSIEVVNEAQGDGERLKLRAHLRSHLAETLAALPRDEAEPRPALGVDAPEASATPEGTALAPAARLAARGLLLALRVPAVRRLAAPLLEHDFDSWIELRASTADLADGAAALLPEVAQLKALGIEPPAGDGPLAQTWTGPATPVGEGLAQVSLLRLDRRHLPATLAALLGTRPFSLAAAIVSVVEPRLPRRRSGPRSGA